MKYVLFSFILFIVLSVNPLNAQTPLTEEQISNYRIECKNKPEERMSSNIQNSFCDCTADAMRDGGMTLEDGMAMQSDGREQREAMNRMALNVYAPCMEHPVRGLVFSSCMKDQNLRKQNICACLANNMAAYIQAEGPEALQTALNENPDIEDPLETLTSSPAYGRMERRVASDCILGNL